MSAEGRVKIVGSAENEENTLCLECWEWGYFQVFRWFFMVWYWVVDSGFCLDRFIASRRNAMIIAAKRAARLVMSIVRLRTGPDFCSGMVARSIIWMVEPDFSSSIFASVSCCSAI